MLSNDILKETESKKICAPYFLGCYILNNPMLLENNIIANIDIDYLGTCYIYNIYYKIKKASDIFYLKKLFNQELNKYSTDICEGLYNLRFAVPVKYNYLFGAVYGSGMESISKKMLLDTFKFIKNPDCSKSSRDSFYLLFSGNLIIWFSKYFRFVNGSLYCSYILWNGVNLKATLDTLFQPSYVPLRTISS